MAITADGLLRELAEPWLLSGKKRAIEEAAKSAGLSYWRAFDIWYGKARRILPAEITQLETAVARQREQGARNELRELQRRLDRLATLLESTDEDFYRPSSVALREQIRALGGKRGASNSSMD